MKNKLQADLVSAMKSKDATRISAIRAIKAAISIAELAPGATALGEADILKVIQKLIKQREDSAEQYRLASRLDLAEIECNEIDIMKEYLPKPLTTEEVTIIVEDAIKETGASSMRDMGKVMAIVNTKVAGRANGGEVAGIVKRLLN